MQRDMGGISMAKNDGGHEAGEYMGEINIYLV